jgi:hypothetical protein
MADVLKLHQSTIGQTVQSLRSDSKAAKAAAAAPPPTKAQAIDATARLMKNWSDRKSSEGERYAIVEMYLHFPLPVVEECSHPWFGIARTKTSKGEVREWPPSAPEVAAWCENLLADCYALANPPAAATRPATVPPPPSPEDAERVRQVVKAITDRLTRAVKCNTEEDLKAQAEEFLREQLREANASFSTPAPEA